MTTQQWPDPADQSPAPQAEAAEPVAPIDMVLHCPACSLQHIDAPENGDADTESGWVDPGWTNPPHRSHLCHGCGHIWRPADVPTNGVAEVKTRGKADSAAPGPRGENAGGVALPTMLQIDGILEHEIGFDPQDNLQAVTKEELHRIATVVSRACATDWGLRIAEKGDAS